jgi:precorrin-6A/cobalt-precorrin-6A reductase
MHADQPNETMGANGNRLWLIAGTGEGPALARQLLERGWRLRVSVVTHTASQPYPKNPDLEIVVGALADAGVLRSLLEAAESEGDPFQWLIDASHPFAIHITPMALEATRGRPERLLRLERPGLEAPWATSLNHLDDLPSHVAENERLLLAIGARQLGNAVCLCRGALLHARVLPYPEAMRQAQQAGIPATRLACFHPTADGAVELALCRQWKIDVILCRQSGGLTEALWQQVAQALGLRLLLLRRPAEPEGIQRLAFQSLIERVGRPDGESLPCCGNRG